MTLEETARALHLSIGLLLLWFLLFWCWRGYRIDAFRQRLFSLRDKLFDYAANGSVSFDEPAYMMLRNRINGMIRFADCIAFPRIVWTIVAVRVLPKPLVSKNQWDQALNLVSSADVRGEMKRLHLRMLVLVVKHLVTGSPILSIIYALISIRALLRGMTKEVSNLIISPLVASKVPGLDVIEAQAVDAITREMGVDQFGRKVTADT